MSYSFETIILLDYGLIACLHRAPIGKQVTFIGGHDTQELQFLSLNNPLDKVKHFVYDFFLNTEKTN